MSGTDSVQKPQICVKYDFYQTETNVVVTILVKNVQKEQSQVSFSQEALNVSLMLPDGTQHVRTLRLLHQVNPDQCSYTITGTKVEVKLKKLEEIRWDVLETSTQKTETLKQIPQAASTATGPLSYPTSTGKDWSAIEKEITEQEAKEKPVSDDAVNKLFQDIYGKGDDSVKRAMNKSFFESNGTVLSTNWGEISKEKVDVKPPDGMEFKKWEA